jgi:hypothetical protein
MSIEVASQERVLERHDAVTSNVSSDTNLEASVGLQDLTTSSQPNTPIAPKENGMMAEPPMSNHPQSSFCYGKLHDLESIWWIALWWLFRTVPMGSQLLPVASDSSLYRSTVELFPSCPDPARLAKRLTMIQGSSWDKYIPTIAPEYRDATKSLNEMRAMYLRATIGPLRNLEDDSNFYSRFQYPLKGTMRRLENSATRTVVFWGGTAKKRRDSEFSPEGTSKKQRLVDASIP